VRDANGYALAYVYFEDEPGRISGDSADARRGAAHRREHRQAARLAAVLNLSQGAAAQGK
jgi:hypothetical protein